VSFKTRFVFVAVALVFTSQLYAADTIRWTTENDSDGNFFHVLEVLKQKTGVDYSPDNFLLEDDRDLAFSHYRRYVQVKDNFPIHQKSLRIWTELKSDKTIQVEANLESPSNFSQFESLKNAVKPTLTSEKTMALVHSALKAEIDSKKINGISWKDEWKNGQLRRFVKVRGNLGYHLLEISLNSKKVISHEYREFPQEDEFSLDALVFPVYEETDWHNFTQRVPSKLLHLFRHVPAGGDDIYSPLQTEHFYGATFDPSLGLSPAGRAKGFWSMAYVKDEAAKIRAGLPMVPNDFAHGILLQGRYATVNIHPDALTKFGPWDFTPVHSTALFPKWIPATYNGQPDSEMVPSQAYQNKPIFSAEEVLNRPARRLPDHDPRQYMSDGFDEIQVYWAIDTLFTELHARGWTDPELSTRPFNAFLYNPEISVRDNAYYTDDTINFSTYSPLATNPCRNNTTIWHELGHGVMDRLMGDNIELGDSGGLSEGMADFTAAMMVRAITKGAPFADSDKARIINNTGFNLTNEVHDDGEAYGGTMRDFMLLVIKDKGEKGLDQVADVVLEAMRLSRDFPGLTAADWFTHLLYADSLGRAGLRLPGELKPFLQKAMASRNYKFNAEDAAKFKLVNLADQKEVVAGGPGSRSRPLEANLAKDGQQSYEITASVKNSDEYQFIFPVKVHVQFNGWARQGPVHWVGEENGAQEFTLKDENDLIHIPLMITGTCDYINNDDGTCSDYVYVEIFNANQSLTDYPVAKKRFYVRVVNP
jgi:hypothetical protein